MDWYRQRRRNSADHSLLQWKNRYLYCRGGRHSDTDKRTDCTPKDQRNSQNLCIGLAGDWTENCRKMEKFEHKGRFGQQREDYGKETRNGDHHSRGKRRHGHRTRDRTGVYAVYHLNQRSIRCIPREGNTVSIKAKVDGADKKAVWRSSNPKAATVNDKGKVTAANAGSTLITAEANGVTAKCWVRVKESKVTLEKKYYLLNTGDTQNLAVDVVGQSQSVKYKSSNTKAVAVRKGVLTAKKAGSAEISVTANGITAKCHVIVTDCKDHEWKPVEEADREEDDVAATCEEEDSRRMSVRNAAAKNRTWSSH